MRRFVRRKNLFNEVKIELKVPCELSSHDVVTPWVSAFKLI